MDADRAEAARDSTPHVVCLSCGYDLTGLADDALCPECAFPVARSRDRSPLLRAADPAWLTRIHRGLADQARAMNILLYTFVVAVVLFAVFLVVEHARGPVSTAGPIAIVPILAVLGLIAAAGLHIRACLLLGTPTHGGFSAHASDRITLRIAGSVLPLCAGYALIAPSVMPAAPLVAARIVQATCQAIAFAYLYSLAGVLRELEARTPEWGEALRQRHRNVRKNLLGLLIIIVVVYWVFSPRGAGAARGWGEFFFGLAYLCMNALVSRVRAAVALEIAIANAGDAATIPAPSRSTDP